MAKNGVVKKVRNGIVSGMVLGASLFIGSQQASAEEQVVREETASFVLKPVSLRVATAFDVAEANQVVTYQAPSGYVKQGDKISAV